MVHEIIAAKGHPNITAKHRTTFQITTDYFISKRADCVIGISADKAMNNLSNRMKKSLQNDDALVHVTMCVGEMEEVVTGHGSSNLACSSDQDVVARKSGFASDRTLMIEADKAAADLSRRLIERLKKSEDITICVEVDV